MNQQEPSVQEACLVKEASLLDCLPETIRQSLDPTWSAAKSKLNQAWVKLRPGVASFVRRRPRAALLAVFFAGFLVASALGHIILTAFVAVGGLAFILFAWVDRLRRLWQGIVNLDLATIKAMLQEMLVAALVSTLLAVMAQGVTGVFIVLLGEILLTFYGVVKDLLQQDPVLAPAVS